MMNTRADIEADIWQKGSVNREHLLAFLKLIPTSDGAAVKSAVEVWLRRLHDDPHYSKISFPVESGTDSLGVPGSAIDRVLSDLTNYGRVTHETVLGAGPNILTRER